MLLLFDQKRLSLSIAVLLWRVFVIRHMPLQTIKQLKCTRRCYTRSLHLGVLCYKPRSSSELVTLVVVLTGVPSCSLLKHAAVLVS